MSDSMQSIFRSIVDGTIVEIENPDVLTIGSNAFAGCSLLSQASFPNATVISAGAFSSCSSLESISAPSVEEIGNAAFQGCSNLKSAVFPAVKSIGYMAFANLSGLETAVFDECVSLAGSAFCYCRNLREISLPKVSIIPSNTFSDCGMSEINLPYVSFISRAAFRYCGSLRAAYLPRISVIGESAFMDCTNFSQLHLEGVTKVPTIYSDTFSQGDMSTTRGSVFVPASLYDAFVSASNWSSIASRIVSVSE